jgi:uncharacterized hydrophobic protein (TIGR00271 family)
MLRLRVSLPVDETDEFIAALEGTGGVRRAVSAPANLPAGHAVVSADVELIAADAVVSLVAERGVASDDFLLARQEAIAPSPSERPGSGTAQDFAWVELMGEARANARPIGRFLALMSVSAVVAAIGVIKTNAILIVGAMAISPDLLPICATCVGLVARRLRLVRRAFATLALGLGLIVAVAAALTFALQLTGLLSDSYVPSPDAVGGLVEVDYSTVIVAAAAGVAAMLSFETRASAAVGVAISVTTIPASAYLGVALGSGGGHGADNALAMLAVNVALLIATGTLTLAVQRGLSRPRA